MLTDEQRRRADQILADLMAMVRECCEEEIERLRLAIEMHQQRSLQMVKDDPKIRLSAADYELWEVLGDA
jgi:signal transduction histidine kinase